MSKEDYGYITEEQMVDIVNQVITDTFDCGMLDVNIQRNLPDGKPRIFLSWNISGCAALDMRTLATGNPKEIVDHIQAELSRCKESMTELVRDSWFKED